MIYDIINHLLTDILLLCGACTVAYVLFQMFWLKRDISFLVRIAALIFVLLTFAQIVLGFVGGLNGHTIWP